MKNHVIYALVDPTNNIPFYVGATCVDLNQRLRAHIKFRPYTKNGKSVANKRVRLIKNIIKSGHSPIIKSLENTTIDKVNFLEKFYYEKLTSEGFSLYQHASFFNSGGATKKKDNFYRITLKLDSSLEEPLKVLAKRNGRTINDEIALVVEKHIKEELKICKTA